MTRPNDWLLIILYLIILPVYWLALKLERKPRP